MTYLPICASFMLALLLTPAVRAVARHWGLVARPRADRWHRKPTALYGGVAIFLAVAVVYLVALWHNGPSLTVVGASAFLWLVGLVDDYRGLKPYQKLIGQVMGAALVISADLVLPWTPSPLVNMGLTIFWLVGITNAINILDNMDGLAAGVTTIAAGFLAVNFLHSGLTDDALLLAVLAAALLGFLVYNTNPASIFMGDCGSMFIGFFVASAALLDSTSGRTRSFLPVLAVPVLVLCIPIFDITLVTVLRKLAGRAASQGGRDHTSHRLVALGLSERRAVGLLYGLAALSGLLALGVRYLELDLSLVLIAAFTLALTFLGIHLARVRVYSEEELRAARGTSLVSFLIDLSYKRRVFEVLLDVVLIILAYYASHVLLGARLGSAAWATFAQTAPILVFVKLGAFLTLGVYRGLWRYVSVDSLLTYAKAVLAGSVASVVAVVLVFRFERFSRGVFMLDGLILLVLLGGSRFAFRLLRRMLPDGQPRQGRRVLIYGAGDAGELLARELLNNPRLACTPVGFADDDPLKAGRRIHGLPVLGGNGSFVKICTNHGVEEVLISSETFTEERVQQILRDCRIARVALKRLRLQIEAIGED